MKTINNENINGVEKNDKISVTEYLNNKELLVVTYLPFDTKMEIVSGIINNVIETVGGLNTTLLRRIATEVFIESITNINLNQLDDNNLKGFDTLCYLGELDALKEVLGREYDELNHILSERVNDYIRMETNPALTINSIYNQTMDLINKFLVYLKDVVKDVDVDNLVDQLSRAINLEGGELNES